MRHHFLLCSVLYFLVGSGVLQAQTTTPNANQLLQSGPMLGYTDMFETMIWVQTTEAAWAHVEYWPEEDPTARHRTEPVTTQKETGFTAHLLADEVLPGKTYLYALFLNRQRVELPYTTAFRTQPLWQYRTDPPAIKLALGSCIYINEEEYDRPGKPYGGDYQILTAINDQKPDLMLWLGDNVYLRTPDWFTHTGFIHRYTHTRSVPELQPLLASTHHYAIWDDHDYGPNDSDRSFAYKDLAKEVFTQFWANPVYGLPGNEGITSYFQWGDVDFFLLDNRTFRTPNNRRTGPCTLLGEEQLGWLIDALAASTAPFKFVAIGGQVLTTYANYETYSNLCPTERDYLLRQIELEGIRNVVFLTGDRHHSELSQLSNRRGNKVYDFTVSPLTASPHVTDEPNHHRVEGTLVTERNFGIIEVTGPRRQRQLTLRVFNANGQELWSQVIQQQ